MDFLQSLARALSDSTCPAVGAVGSPLQNPKQEPDLKQSSSEIWVRKETFISLYKLEESYFNQNSLWQLKRSKNSHEGNNVAKVNK